MATPITSINIERGKAYWQEDFRASQSEEGIWTGSQSFLCFFDDAFSLVPVKGFQCPSAAFLKFSRAEVERAYADKARVTCYFSGSTNQEIPQPDNFDREEYSVSLSEEPIETHPRYSGLSDLEKINIQNLKNGRLKFISQTGGETPTGTYTLVMEDKESTVITFTGAALELVTKIQNGVMGYLDPKKIRRRTYGRNSPLDDSEDVGKIADDGYLYVGYTQLKTGEGYEIVKEYHGPGRGGWDEDLYGEDSDTYS
jgi:hypothetical protein